MDLYSEYSLIFYLPIFLVTAFVLFTFYCLLCTFIQERMYRYIHINKYTYLMLQRLCSIYSALDAIKRV